MVIKRFAVKIRKLRQAKGFSQEEFALIIGLDRTYYASVETGRRNISLRNIKKIADGFGVTLSELFKDI